MAELIPAPFADLVTRLADEPRRQDSLFELPRRKWYLPRPGDPDLSVVFHGHRAGNPAGPAAGPHTQMAQNLLLSYVAGARILELKTVQINDRLDIPRPCIDMTNIGYNVEWSQELRIDDSLREYVAGAMLIVMFRQRTEHHGTCLDGPAGDWLFDLSVGYDLAGIRSKPVCRFLNGMRDASTWVNRLRDEVPRHLHAWRDADYPTHLSDSITLSTFHGCPADEIESICEFLIGEMNFDVIVKMNPPTLGKDRLEHLLHNVMGYHDLQVNPDAYGAAITFDESIGLCRRLTGFAERHNRRLGFKFSNTLEVLNHRSFFGDENKIMYLSGQPLHVITMALTDAFRQAVGPAVPISFSAGIDQHNFAEAVACGFVPVTISSDLLRPGGYGRLPAYLHRIADAMKQCDAPDIDTFMLRRYGKQDEAEQRTTGNADAQADTVRWAALLNTHEAAAAASADPRYAAEQNQKIPKRIDSHLVVFDCITCDKCLPVCPNAANFTYPTPLTAFDYHDLLVHDDGRIEEGDKRHFEITRDNQIACYADFCNECGNCDTFCPEYGGPYIEKPSFFGSRATFDDGAPRDGFLIDHQPDHVIIVGRVKGALCSLAWHADRGCYLLDDGHARLTFQAADHALQNVASAPNPNGPHHVDMWAYHTLRHLLHGVLDPARINQVNAAALVDTDS